jgi:DNA primase
MNNIDPTTTKYLIRAKIVADGVVEKPDVVGAIFGQTEGLIGDELDLRDLQKGGRIGRIEVNMNTSKGRSDGEILVPSSLDQVETSILAAALETIDRVGPCKARIETIKVEDVRAVKKAKIIERAKKLLETMIEESKAGGVALTETVRQAVQAEEIISFGPDKCPAGPNIGSSDAIIVVEGRSDVLNLLKYGIKNAIAVEGTNIPATIRDLSKDKVVTAFVDGDRGGELILKELLQVAEVDFITRAPRGREVEELTQKQIMKALRSKMPAEQFIEMYGLTDVSVPAAPEHVEKKPAERVVKGGKPRARDRERPSVEHPLRQHAQQEEMPIAKPSEPTPTTTKLSEELLRYKTTLAALSGTFKASLFNSKGEIIKELAVRDLAQSLKRPPKGVTAVVFDGVITQRLIDLAAENNIKTIVGVKLGNVTKQPVNIDIITKTQFEV